MKLTTLRGQILEFLKHVYPNGVDDKTVVRTFYEYHKHTDIVQSLQYLADKGYVAKQGHDHPYLKAQKFWIYKIAPAGIDILDGTVTDPGVTVLPEEA
jgi:hypothetical protein